MAFWHKKIDAFDEVTQIIRQKPGITQSELARLLNVERSTIARRLPGIEEAGYLYSEDKKGGLWYFGKRK